MRMVLMYEEQDSIVQPWIMACSRKKQNFKELRDFHL